MYPPAIDAPKSWLQRNVVLVVCVVVVVGLLGLTAAGIGWGFSMMGNSDAVRLAFDTANASPVMIERLGSPLKKGWLVSGSIEITGPSGHAELAIPVSGPRGTGTLYAEAHKRAGLWQLDLLQFGTKDSSDRLDLLAGASPPPATHLDRN